MNKKLDLFLSVSLLSYSLVASAAIDPSSLIKVTSDNNSQCIEFFNYKEELYCNTDPNSISSVVDPKIKDLEKQTIFFDERPWQAIWGFMRNNG